MVSQSNDKVIKTNQESLFCNLIDKTGYIFAPQMLITENNKIFMKHTPTI